MSVCLRVKFRRLFAPPRQKMNSDWRRCPQNVYANFCSSCRPFSFRGRIPYGTYTDRRTDQGLRTDGWTGKMLIAAHEDGRIIERWFECLFTVVLCRGALHELRQLSDEHQCQQALLTPLVFRPSAPGYIPTHSSGMCTRPCERRPRRDWEVLAHLRCVSATPVCLKAATLRTRGSRWRNRPAPFTRSSNHQANVEQTSSKHQAITAHVVQVYFECICWCLLDDCSMFVWSCKRHIMVRTLDLRSSGRGFDYWSGPHVCRWVNRLGIYITNTEINSAFYPSGVDKSSAGQLCLRRDAFFCIEWRVLLRKV